MHGGDKKDFKTHADLPGCIGKSAPVQGCVCVCVQNGLLSPRGILLSFFPFFPGRRVVFAIPLFTCIFITRELGSSRVHRLGFLVVDGQELNGKNER